MNRTFAKFCRFGAASAAIGTLYYTFHKEQRLSFGIHPSNERYTPLRVISIDQQTPSVFRVRLGLPTDHQSLAELVDPTVQTVYYVNIKENSSQSYRPFTPITNSVGNGESIDLYVKRYAYPCGEVARHITETLPGEAVEVHGPHPSYRYQPPPSVSQLDDGQRRRKINMIAGGTGVLPMIQLMQIIHRLPGDYSAMDLVFLNRNPDELFLIKELEEWRHRMGRKNPLTINFVVDHLPAARNPLHIQQGLLTEDMLRRLLATSDGNPPHKDDILLICGPPGLYRHLGININRQEGLKLTPNSPLLNLGFQQQQVIVFHDQQLMGNG